MNTRKWLWLVVTLAASCSSSGGLTRESGALQPSASVIPAEEPASNPTPSALESVATAAPGGQSTATLRPIVPPQEAPPPVAAEVVRVFDHDSEAFTQGLLVDGGKVVESTGLVGESSLRRIDLATGEVESVAVDGGLFAEGIAAIGDVLIQLTWQDGVALVYDRATLEHRRSFSYEGEGWGLASVGDRLAMSDGSSTIWFRSPQTFEIIGSVEVVDDGEPVAMLNELEMVGDELWANVWLTSLIARINPATGGVVGWLDLATLRPIETLDDHDAVANGIAYDQQAERLYVSGKRWDVLYEIAVPAPLL